MPPTRTAAGVHPSLKCIKLEKELRPVCSSISCLKDALATDAEREGQWLRCDVPLSKTWASEPVSKQRVLVCHDMKGGYLEDRYLQGAEVMDSYRFWHWQHADIWVYFSHDFITVPPPAWTAAAHRHGVKVLGTLITEHEVGVETCCEFLLSKESYQKLADKLVALAHQLGFEGWLLNIENKIEPDQVSSLEEFVKYLDDKSHEDNADSLLLWYDSVIETGELQWQNELNSVNRSFFEASDGLFTNYCWKEEMLEKSAEEEKKLDRCGQVLIGVDIFGRGCHGGGGFSTADALTIIKKHNLSVAMFAPGWVYETQGKENFTANNNRFWREVHSLLTHRVVTKLPLSTSFCQGFGQAFYCCGEEVLSKPWSNMGLQQLQPNCTNSLKAAKGKKPSEDYPSEESKDDDKTRMVTTMPPLPACVYTQDAYLGGSCLLFNANLAVDFNHCPLFKTELTVASDLLLSLTVKFLDPEPCSVSVHVLLTKEEEGKIKEKIVHTPYVFGGSGLKAHLAKPVGAGIAELSELEGAAVNQYLPVKLENKNGWMTRHFLGAQALFEGWTMKEVDIVVESKIMKGKTQILLGQLCLREATASGGTPVEHPFLHDLVCQEWQAQDLGLELRSESEEASGDGRLIYLRWQCPTRKDVAYFNIYRKQDGKLVCVGHTVHSWYILPRETVTLTENVQVLVQPVLAVGLPVPLDSCASVKLPTASVKLPTASS